MEFTAADGLPMGTRRGGLDVGVMLYLMDEPTIARHTRRSIAGQ
jgi:acetate kinase